jgi:hypothetical protein
MKMVKDSLRNILQNVVEITTSNMFEMGQGIFYIKIILLPKNPSGKPEVSLQRIASKTSSAASSCLVKFQLLVLVNISNLLILLFYSTESSLSDDPRRCRNSATQSFHF